MACARQERVINMISYYKTIDGCISRVDNLEPGCWVNVIAPDEQEIAVLKQTFQVESEYILSSLDEEESSHIETEDGHTFLIFDVPYVVLSILPRIRQMNKSVYEAALDLGATPALAFRKVILPDILPGIFSGALLAFTMSFDDFIISYYTSGPGFVTLSVYINTMTKRAVPLTVNALSTFIFVMVFILLLITNLRNKKTTKEVA